MTSRYFTNIFIIIILFVSSLNAMPQSDEDSTKSDIFGINKTVTSITNRTEPLFDVAASVYIIDEEDIRHSGATRLQDVLKIVPGVWFDELSYTYNTSAIRSPANIYSQSVSVNIDGYPVVSPVFASPDYNFLDIPVKRIKRIEVIKGPHGVLYGLNANTGIINIFTKNATENEGIHIYSESTTFNSFSSYICYGQNLLNMLNVSGYLHFHTTSGYKKNSDFLNRNLIIENGRTNQFEDTLIVNKFTGENTDGRNSYNLGLNVQADNIIKNLKASANIDFSYISSNVYTASILKEEEPFVFNENQLDFLFSAHANYTLSKRHNFFSDLNIQFLNNNLPASGGYNFKNLIFNFNVNDQITAEFNELCFGLNIRAVGYVTSLTNEKDLNFRNNEKTELLYAAYALDKVSYKDFLYFWFGIRAEAWTLVGEYPIVSPNARIAFKPDKLTTFWMNFSRTVMSPGYIQANVEFRKEKIPYISSERAEYLANQQGLTGEKRIQFLEKMAYYRSLFLPGTNELYIAEVPGDGLQPPDYLTYEAGLKKVLNPKAMIDLSVFYTHMNNGIELDENYQSKAVIYSELFDNQSLWPIYYTSTFKSNMFGGEFLCQVIPREYLKFELSYSLFYNTNQEIDNEASPAMNEINEPYTPMHTIRFRPTIKIPRYNLNITVNSLWASETYRGTPFNYVTQQYDQQNGVYKDPAAARLELDIFVEKHFFDKKLILNMWGKNLLVNKRINFSSERISIGYPHSIHRSFGFSIYFDWNFFNQKKK